MKISLSKALRLTRTSKVAFVGAGGKTSAITTLARELPKPLVVSTTTHLGTWQSSFADNHVLLRDKVDWKRIENSFSSGINLITHESIKERFSGLNNSEMLALNQLCEKLELPLLLECDGSRQLPLKAPGISEPPIPGFVDMVVVVAGLSGIGNTLNEHMVYNPEIFSLLGDLPMGDEITCSAIEKVLIDQNGGLKNIPNHAKRVLLLNQADTLYQQIQAGKISRNLNEHFDKIIISELNKDKIHLAMEPTAAIILAAGSSSRFGKSKQLLDFQGIPFIKAVTLSAIDAGLSPIVVITGADSKAVREALHELTSEIYLVFNPNWQDGQSTSIRAGLNFLDSQDIRYSQNYQLTKKLKDPGSIIFLLADQPQMTPAVLRSLVEEHSLTLSPVIAPLVDGKRTNPVLFDKETFPDLKKLEGDVGGRAIFSKYPPHYIEWNDRSLVLDVDNPSDYARLVNG